MKKLLLMVWATSFHLLGTAQTHTVDYHEATGVNGGITASVNFNYLSTCQTSVSLDGSCGIWNGFVWSSGNFSVIVNGTNLGSFPTPTTLDLTPYIPITSLQVTSNAGTWHTVDASLHVTSNSASAPALPTTPITSYTYCQGATAAQLMASLNGTGASLRWYTDQYGSGHTTTAPTPSTAAVGTRYYGVSQLNASGCEGPRQLIQVNVVSAANQSVSLISSSLICSGSTDVHLGGSEAGMNYYLRNDADNTVISGPVAGTGAAIDLNTGVTTTTTTYNVYAQSASGALDFDGVDDYVDCGNSAPLTITGDITLETWVKVDATSSDWVRLVGKGDFINRNYGLWLNPSGFILWQIYGTTDLNLSTTNVITPGSGWHHIAATRSGSICKIYLDGVEMASTTYTGVPLTTTSPLTIGAGVPGVHKPLIGQMDETRVWNVARSQSEIRSAMYKCLVGTETGLVAYYKYENGVNSTTLTDVLGGANGTLTNMNPAQDWVSGSGTCGSCSAEMTSTPTLTVNALSNQTTAAAAAIVCPNTGTTITTASSQSGVTYYLRNDATNAVVDGPTTGTGSALTFSTGNLSSTTTYNVYAESNVNGILLDGVNDEIITTDPVSIGGRSFSVEVWAKRNSIGTNDFIVSQGTPGTDQALHFGFRGSNEFTMAFWADDINTAAITDLNWHHWVGTYDAITNTQNLYMDGVLAATRIASGDYNGSGVVHVGNTGWGADNFGGNLDELRIWNYALSASEVSANMSNCVNGNEMGLLLYYNFNQVSGSTTATDHSVNANEGILTNVDENIAWQTGVSNCSCNLEMTNTVTVTVQDNAPTVATSTSNINVNVDASTCGAIVNYTSPTFNDDCDGNGLSGTLTAGLSSGSLFPVGITTVTYAYTDASSQTTNSSFTVTVVDNEAPVLASMPTDVTIAANNNGCTGIVTWTEPTASDVCGGTVVITSDYASGDAFTVGTTTVTYTATDDAGNFTTSSFDVTVTNDFAVVGVVTGDVSCNGGNDGFIDITISGGTAPYTVIWDGTINSEDLSGLSAGTYAGFATDANGCADAGSVTIFEPSAIDVTVDFTTDPSVCGLNDGTASITVNGGTVSANYGFSWTDGGSYTSSNEDPTDLAAGSYTVTVTDDNSCTGTASLSVVDPNGPTVSLNASSVLNLNCNGDVTGDIQIDVVLNGTATSATYLWNDVNGSTTEDISGVSAGSYTLEVTDNNNCIATIDVDVIEPDAIDISTAITNVTCNGNQNGSIDITVTGGISPYSFNWVDPNNFTSVTEDVNGLHGGDYTVTITDDNGCTASSVVTVNEPSVMAATAIGFDEMQGNDGSVNLIVTGGSAPYGYSWTGPNGFTSTTEDPSGLVAGTYDVIVTDANGCTENAQVTIGSQVGVSELNTVQVSIYPNPSNGIFNLTLSNAGQYNVSAINAVGQVVFTKSVNGTQTTLDLSTFERGVYFITIENASNKMVQRVVLMD